MEQGKRMEQAKKLVHASEKDIFPYSGKGITIAVLDSGAALHPDLNGRIVAFHDFVNGRKYLYDDNGHGTHVAGCLAGSGICSNGKYSGIAPQSRLVVCKILDEKGEGCAYTMLEALEWCLRNKDLYHIRIFNISIGIDRPVEREWIKEVSEYLKKAWEKGILPVVSAGNQGPADDSISELAKQDCVIAVGCYDGKTDSAFKNCEIYSGRGALHSVIRKPDLVAPGTDIVSCNAFFRRLPGERTENAYVKMDGTSMAVPIVCGAAALLWQKTPLLYNTEIKRKLLLTAKDLRKPVNYQGWGLLDVKKLLRT